MHMGIYISKPPFAYLYDEMKWCSDTVPHVVPDYNFKFGVGMKIFAPIILHILFECAWVRLIGLFSQVVLVFFDKPN